MITPGINLGAWLGEQDSESVDRLSQKAYVLPNSLLTAAFIPTGI